MGHEEIHINVGLRGYRSCICMCRECYTAKGVCICKECTCTDTSQTRLHSAYYREPVAVVAHSCTSCGTEVTRKSNRGRWPTKCMRCKA